MKINTIIKLCDLYEQATKVTFEEYVRLGNDPALYYPGENWELLFGEDDYGHSLDELIESGVEWVFGCRQIEVADNSNEYMWVPDLHTVVLLPPANE